MLRAAASGQGIPGGPTQGRDPSSGRSGAWVENGKRIRKPERLLIHPSFAFHAPDGSERRPYHASHSSRVTGLNPNSEVQFRIQAFGTTETLRTTEKTEFEEIGDKSLFRAFKYFSVNSVVLSISVVFRQVFLTQLRSPG